MSILWIAPLALAGLALIALPIAVHLFARQPVRTLRFPSLRFLHETQLAAFRRRRIEDAALLVCRAAIVAAAAAALAGPIFQTPARTAGYANRMSRAVVLAGVGGEEGERGEAGAYDVFRSARFHRDRLVDAVADAARWLEAQPPSLREVLVVGRLPHGEVDAVDFSSLPQDVGIRFATSPIMVAAEVESSVLTLRDGRLMHVTQRMRPTPDATTVSEGNAVAVPANLVTIAARQADAPLADAALRAALGAGVPWEDFNQRVAIVWPGGDEFAATASDANVRVIRMPVPSPASSAADAVLAALKRASPPIRYEPFAISYAQLDAWSRPPGPPPADAPIADEGDRRWLWGLALALLMLEAWLRRHRNRVNEGETQEPEARVA